MLTTVSMSHCSDSACTRSGMFLPRIRRYDQLNRQAAIEIAAYNMPSCELLEVEPPLRIWMDEAKGIARGHIQHTSSREAVHFMHLDTMVKFIVNHLGAVDNHPKTEVGNEGLTRKLKNPEASDE